MNARSPWLYPDGPLAIGRPRDGAADPSLPVTDASTLERDTVITAEVVIIGSGAGGAVMAAELAAAGLDVVVIEQGKKFERADFHDAPLKSFLEMYESGGMTMTTGTPAIALPFGRAIGGTTIVNSGTCFRIPEAVHEKWARAGLGALSSKELEPYFDKVEKRINVSEVPAEVAGPNTDVVRRGVEKLGLSGGYLRRNARGCVGSGRCAFGCPSGAKQSMERSYLPDAAAKGARIYSQARVDRILIENGRAAGVHAVARGGGKRSLVVKADRVVIAAGAIGTPLLLKRNRLGGRAVGKHLHIHPAAKVVARLDEKVGGRGVPQSYYVDSMHADGLMLEGAYVPPELSALALPFYGHEHRALMEEADHFATFGMMVTDESEGHVLPGFGESAIIRYDLGRKDTERFHKGIALCARIFLAAGATAVYAGLPQLEKMSSEADVVKLESLTLSPKDFELAAFHPMGSCRAGIDPRTSVVDLDLELHDLPGLTIADASVIPSSIGVNPQLTIMALATRAAAHLVANHRE